MNPVMWKHRPQRSKVRRGEIICSAQWSKNWYISRDTSNRDSREELRTDQYARWPVSQEQETNGGFPGGEGVVARRGGGCAVLCPCYAVLQCNPCITSNHKVPTDKPKWREWGEVGAREQRPPDKPLPYSQPHPSSKTTEGCNQASEPRWRAAVRTPQRGGLWMHKG